MIKGLTIILVAFSLVLLGIWFGYDRGIKNQIYFDAPAKIALYNAVLEKEESEMYLERELIYQVRLMESMESETNELLLHHPTHTGMKDIYLSYKPRIEELHRVKSARNEIKAYNKSKN